MTTTTTTTTTLEAPTVVAPALSKKMQHIARDYVAARGRAGAALLDQARYLAEAREAAKHGEWLVFLEATQTSEDWAGRLLRIADDAARDERFAEAIRSNFLTMSTATELLTAPASVRDAALNGSTAPTVKGIREAKRAANPATSPGLHSEITTNGAAPVVSYDDTPAPVVDRDDNKLINILAPTTDVDDRTADVVDHVAADRDILAEASVVIERRAYAYARVLLGRVTTLVDERDALAARIPDALPFDVQQQLITLGASIDGGGTVYPPPHTGEAPMVMTRPEAAGAIARWSALADVDRHAPTVVDAPAAALDDRRRAIDLLDRLAPIMAAVRPRNNEALAVAMEALATCVEGTEAAHWVAVGWALLEVDN